MSWYLVGTPRGRLSQLEGQLFAQPWKQVQEQIEVKLARDGEDLYVLTRSGGRCDKERSMRRRTLKKLWKRLHEIQGMKNQKRDALLLRLGAAREQAGKAWELVDIDLPGSREAVNPETFRIRLNLKKLRKARRGEGTYLLRTNLTAGNPEELWKQYIVLTEVEQAFKELKNDLDIRPVYHQKDDRIESHIGTIGDVHSNVSRHARVQGANMITGLADGGPWGGLRTGGIIITIGCNPECSCK